MHTRTLGQGLEVSAVGLGCMGMSQGYGPNPGAAPEMIAVLRGALDRRRHVLRHRRGLRPVRQRGARRRGARTRPRPGGDRDQVRVGHPGRRDVGVDSRPEHIREVADASLRGCAPTGSTCSTSTGSTPTCPSRTSPARSLSWCRRARSSTSGCPRPAPPPSAAPTPSTPSPRCRASTRSGPGTPSPRCCRSWPSSDRLRAVQPARASGFFAGSVAGSTQFADGDIRGTIPRSLPRTARPTRRWSTTSAGSPRPRARPRPGRAGLVAGPAAADGPDPRHATPGTARGERRRHAVALSADEVADLDALASGSGCRATATTTPACRWRGSDLGPPPAAVPANRDLTERPTSSEPPTYGGATPPARTRT